MNFISNAAAGIETLLNNVKVDETADVTSLYGRIDKVITLIISLVAIIIFIYVIYGGFLYLTSQGDTAKTQKAQQILLYAIIGAVILALAYGITALALKIVNGN